MGFGFGIAHEGAKKRNESEEALNFRNRESAPRCGGCCFEPRNLPMTQLLNKIHSARQALEAVGRKYPGAWVAIEKNRLEVKALYEWPDFVFIPVEAVSSIEWHTDKQAQLALTAVVTAMANWRMTKGIYRFDPTLYAALADTPLEGGLPADVLQRLPEWCVYLETPGLMDIEPADLRTSGAWAWLGYNTVRHRVDLHLLLERLRDPNLPLEHLKARFITVPLTGLGLEESLSLVIQPDADPTRKADSVKLARPIISMLLYLCSQDADISGRGKPGNPQPVRTRRDGWKMFAADGLRTWDVGVRLGAALRRAYQAAESGGSGASSSPRGHVRRSHWHGYRSGPMKAQDGAPIPAEKRRFDVRWLPPIAVNLESIDDLPAVVKLAK